MVALAETSTWHSNNQPSPSREYCCEQPQSRFNTRLMEQRHGVSAASTIATQVGNSRLALPVSECNRRLQLWANYRGQEDEDGIVWPSSVALHKTLKFLSDLDDAPMPMFMAPDGDGGISLEWRAGNCSTRVLIDSDGGLIQRRFRDSQLIDTRSC